MLELPSARRTSLLISIAVFSCWFGFVPAQAQDKTVDAIAQVESGLLSPIAIKGEATKRMTLHERMTRYKVPAVSLAVIDGGRIVWSRSYGFVDDDGTPATPDTLFQAASISKPVTAAAALMFVGRGALELDAPVNRYLSSWTVPESPRASADAVTLRRLLSHSAGISVHGFDGYEASRSAPTLQEILDGRPPAQSRPIRIEQAPAIGWQYSGGGYTIIQQLLEDVGGQSFPRLMSESVLESAGMKTSTFLQPLNGEFAGRAATGYQADGRPVAGRWHIYPELAAAGLWTTPSDLARFALWTMAEDSARPPGPPPSIRLLRERQPGLVTPHGGMGLGFFVGGEGEGRYFLHGGGNAGFRCYLIGFPATGQGVAIMTNSDGGTSLALELARSVAAAYQWPDRQQRLVRARRIDRRTLARRAGVYHSGSTTVTISAVPGGLEARQDDNPAVILRAENDKTFVDPESGTEYRFSRPTAEAGDTLLITPPRGNATTLRRRSIRRP